MNYRAVLDPSAIAAYAAGSEHVGEVLAEIADEQARFARPVVALIEARTGISDGEADRLDVLAGLKYADVLPLHAHDWQRIAAATQLLGGDGRACAALLVHTGVAGYVMTADPDEYGGIETIAIS